MGSWALFSYAIEISADSEEYSAVCEGRGGVAAAFEVIFGNYFEFLIRSDYSRQAPGIARIDLSVSGYQRRQISSTPQASAPEFLAADGIEAGHPASVVDGEELAFVDDGRTVCRRGGGGLI